MKVKIKDLQPNPHRGWEEFQLHRPTVEMLKDSILETFFWENVIGRQVNGKVQIAYGHHRLQALRELYPKGNKMFSIAVYPLDDEQMFIIMARENETGKNLTIPNIDLTVKKAKEFLEANLSIAKKHGYQEGKGIIGKRTISNFLGWDEFRVQNSLERQRGIDETHLDKEAVESMPTELAARDFVRAVKKIKASPQIQKKVAKKIVESRNKDSEEKSIVGETAIKAELLEEKHGFERRKKEEEKTFEKFLHDCRKKTDSLKSDFKMILKYKEEFESDFYNRTFEKWDLLVSIKHLIFYAQKLMKGDGNEEKKEKRLPL